MILNDKKLPYWMDMLWEEAEKKTTKFLNLNSEDYKNLKEEKSKILEEYPELAAVLEGDILEQEIVLDANKVRKLSELFGICTDILWLYEKMFYAFGLLEGAKLSEALNLLDGISE